MKKSNYPILFVFNLFMLVCLGGTGFAADHLLAIAHEWSATKAITIYEPDGTLVFSYVTPGGVAENTPTFIESVADNSRFIVACPDGGATTEGSVEVFDYSGYPAVNGITHIQTLTPGNKPFHTEVTPDNQFIVANDGDNTFTLIDPVSLTTETISAGANHLTFAFAGDASSYDIYVGRFFGPGNPGGVDIVDGVSRTVRTTLAPFGQLPHTAVYSSLSQRVYFSFGGGVEVFGTQGAEIDTHVDTIETATPNMTPLLSLSPDEQYVVGELHYDAAPGSFFYSYDVISDSSQTLPSVSCKYYAYSPDGKWIAAGDYNKPTSQANNQVHLINCDPTSPNYMTLAASWELTGATASRVGFHAAAFSPDSKTAYLGLTEAHKVMVIDVDTLSASYFDCELRPNWFHVLDTSSLSIADWKNY